MDFVKWPKIKRDNPFNVTITEKIDGTNACVIVENGEVIGVQSRNRFITPDDDNFGFATWVHTRLESLSFLGDGYHYGEWAGPGIQKNPLGLVNKTFFLFNVYWPVDSLPDCVGQVPILFQGVMDAMTVPDLLGALDADPERTHEGVIVYYHAFRTRTKHTIISPNGKWAK